jgi:hypothetical protein
VREDSHDVSHPFIAMGLFTIVLLIIPISPFYSYGTIYSYAPIYSYGGIDSFYSYGGNYNYGVYMDGYYRYDVVWIEGVPIGEEYVNKGR